jgi:putative transcriptional regulator
MLTSWLAILLDVSSPSANEPLRKVLALSISSEFALDQEAFSSRIGVSTGTLRNWEQGRRNPEGPARVLLAMLARNPRVVEETLEKSLR